MIFDSIASTMTDGIDTAKQGLQNIDQVQTALPEIQQLGGPSNRLCLSDERRCPTVTRCATKYF